MRRWSRRRKRGTASFNKRDHRLVPGLGTDDRGRTGQPICPSTLGQTLVRLAAGTSAFPPPELRDRHLVGQAPPGGKEWLWTSRSYEMH
jgi:hypothetical protein